MTKQSARRWYVYLLVALLASALFVLESTAVHHLFTTRFPGANDFYAPWAGARALLLEGRDPYSLSVTAEIQAIKGIDPALQGEGKGGFAYPLHAVISYWPLVYLPYAWAQAIWTVTLHWVTMAIVVVLVRLESWHLGSLGLLGLSLATLFLYPVARSIILGQFTLHVTLFLAATLLALRDDRDAWAGAALALTSIKPQMGILLVPWIVLWAISQRRWQLLTGLLVSGSVLMLISLAVFPRWPISFVDSLMRYSAVAGGRNPIAVLTGLLWPGGAKVVRYGLSAAVVTAMLAAWSRGWGETGEWFTRATQWAIIVSLLVPFQTGTTNQAMLLIPLFSWLQKSLGRWGKWRVIASIAVLQVAIWVLFLKSIEGDWENPIMFLPLPFLGLIIMTGLELIGLRRSRETVATISTDGME